MLRFNYQVQRAIRCSTHRRAACAKVVLPRVLDSHGLVAAEFEIQRRQAVVAQRLARLGVRVGGID